MGSNLGSTFANFYICNLENCMLRTIANLDKCIYSRLMNDILLVVAHYHILNDIKENFEENSVLTFTHEIEVNRKLSFLDALISNESEYLKTAVYTKATNTGHLLNYNSICPDRY